MAREDRVALGKRHLRVDAIDRGGGGDDELPDAVEPRGLQQVDRALDIDALVEGGFLEAGPHPRARGQVDDLVEAHAAEQLVQRGAVGQVAVHELEGLGQGLDVAEVALLEARVVEGIKVVERPDGVAGMQQPLADMRADKARAARDQEIHAGRLPNEAAAVERSRQRR